METKQIINGLLDRADRVADQSAGRIMRQAAERLQELDQEQKWIPVAERKSDADVLVLCIGKKGGMFLGMLSQFDNCANGTCYCSVPNSRNGRFATHWMPLPNPPKEVDHES